MFLHIQEKRLIASLRPVGSRAARRARRAGYVTAVIYGGGAEPTQVQVPALEFRRLLEKGGRGGIFYVHVGAEPRPRSVVLKELQEDHLEHRLLHADFLQVDLDQVVRLVVPVAVVGAEVLANRGQVLEHHVDHVELEGRAGLIPEVVVVDVSALEPGEHVGVAGLPLPPGVRAHADPHQVVVACPEPTRRVPAQTVPVPEIPLETGTAEPA